MVEDTRDMTPVGRVVADITLRQGYVKANGATVLRADYPRLVQFADVYNLWTGEPWGFGIGDGSTTMVLPDYRGRVIQGGDNVAVLAAGLPNITGSINLSCEDGPAPTGAFYSAKSWGDGVDGSKGLFQQIVLNAARSSAIYGASNTVQPPALQLIPQIRY